MYWSQPSSADDSMWDEDLDISAQASQMTSPSSQNHWDDHNSTYDPGQSNRLSNDRVFTRKSNNESNRYEQRNNYSGGRNSERSTKQNWRDSGNDANTNGYQPSRSFDQGDHVQGERQFNRRSGDQNQSSRNSDGSTMNFFIDASQVGRVIGRRGAKINEFVEQSGARIKIDSSSAQQQDEVEVIVRGNPESCQKAKELIEEFIENFSNLQVRDGSRNYNYNSNADNRSDNSFNSVQEPPTSQKSDADAPFDWDYYKHLAVEHEKAKFAGLPKIEKDFYDEHPEVTACSKITVNKLRAERNNITVTKAVGNESEIPNPVWTFEQAYQNHPEILRELKKQGFTGPSPIQCQAWPILLSGHDMIGVAQTGTGKTIAFLLPAFIHIEHQITRKKKDGWSQTSDQAKSKLYRFSWNHKYMRNGEFAFVNIPPQPFITFNEPRAKRVGPTCLVLAPTRELALQIYEEALKYSYRNIKCVCVYGGGSRRDQIKVVTKGVEIVIATPGRLVDLIRSNIIQLQGVSYVVLDEADRMLDMGFEPDVKYIMSYIRPDRQTVLTSATWPEGVARLVSKYMTHPMTVNVGCLDLAAVHTVEQQFYFISEHQQKRELVFEFIESMQPDDKVIIFVDRKAVVDDVASDIQINNIHCASLHGDRCQEDREQALFEFKESHTRILVATDLASRGLDVKDVTHVFNMCMPKNLEDYVHRIGRTGRAGRNGIAISIIDRQDWGIARKLIKILEESGNHVPRELVSMAERYEKKKQEQQLAGGGGRSAFRPRRF